MKKLMILALVLMLSVSAAFAWTCPACELEMNGNFCTECGAKKPANVCPGCGTDFGERLPKFCTECGTKLAAAATATPAPTAVPATPAPTAVPAAYVPRIESITQNDNGTVTVRWNANGETECSIEYFPKHSDDPEADRLAETGFGAAYVYDTSGAYMLSRVTPGDSYWIGVFDGDSQGEYKAYTPQGEVQPFSAFSNMMYGWLVLRQGGADETVQSFTPADMADSAKSCGIYLAMRYNNPGEEHKAVMQLVLEAPNGEKRVYRASYVPFKAQTEDVTGSSFLGLDEYFDLVESCFGEILLGDHTVTVYLDGEMLGTLTVPVTETRQASATATPAPTAAPTAIPAKELTISSVTAMGNGYHLLTWEDNGKGPFDVGYMEHWSDSFEADWQDSRTSAYWSDTEDVTGNSLAMKYLVPGQSYWLVVSDSEGNEALTVYDVPAAQDAGLNLQIISQPRLAEGENYTDLTTFSAAVLNEDYAGEYGLYLDLTYNELPEDTEKPSMWVITLPDGVSFCEWSFDMNWFANGGTYWDHYTLDWAFGKVKGWYGEMLKGQYLFELYVEGQYAGATTFVVGD